MKTRLMVSALAAAALALGPAGCGDDTGNEDEDQIVAVIERVATSGDPAVCTEAQTQRFTETAVGEGITGEQAIKSCEKNADHGVADSVVVTNVEVDGSSATANAAITGSTFNGQTLSLALVKDGNAWKIDEFSSFTVFDREAMTRFLHGGVWDVVRSAREVRALIACWKASTAHRRADPGLPAGIPTRKRSSSSSGCEKSGMRSKRRRGRAFTAVPAATPNSRYRQIIAILDALAEGPFGEDGPIFSALAGRPSAPQDRAGAGASSSTSAQAQ